MNQQSARIAGDVREGNSRAAVARQLGERVADGCSVVGASVVVLEAERRRPGAVVPIGALEEIGLQEVSVEGEVTQLWEPSSPAIAQAGLIEDESARTKWTAWKRSQFSPVSEGDLVRLR